MIKKPELVDPVAVAANLHSTALEFKRQSPAIAARLDQAAGVILQQQTTIHTLTNQLTAARCDVNSLRSVARV